MVRRAPRLERYTAAEDLNRRGGWGYRRVGVGGELVSMRCVPIMDDGCVGRSGANKGAYLESI